MRATFFWLWLVLSLVNTGGGGGVGRSQKERRNLGLPPPLRVYVLGGLLIGWGPVQLCVLAGLALAGLVH
jgi:hypothetical protein